MYSDITTDCLTADYQQYGRAKGVADSDIRFFIFVIPLCSRGRIHFIVRVVGVAGN
jgi:hypothetical protein